MGMLKNALVFAGGYVVGSRAGRERYQQLKERGAALAQRPQVQQAWQKAKGAVTGRAGAAVDQITGDAGAPTPPATTSPGAPAAQEPSPADGLGVSEAELERLTAPDADADAGDRTS